MMKRINWMMAAILACCLGITSCGGDDLAEAFDKSIDKALKPLTEAQKKAHREALQYWYIGEPTDEEAINEFGLENCFTVVAVTKNRIGDSDNINPDVPLSDLREVRSLYLWQEVGNEKNIGHMVGAVICHYSIANDLCHIFRQLYTARYPINALLTTTSNNPWSNILQQNWSFCYSYSKEQISAVSELHHQGLAVCLNPLTPPVKGDKAVELFQQKGFKWDGKYTFNK